MGKAMAMKVRGMNPWAKVGLVVSVTLLASIFMYQGWYLPRRAEAAIGRVQSVVLNNGTSTSGTVTIAATKAGDLVVVVIGGIDSTVGASNVKLGTTVMTKAVGGINTGGPQDISIWYLANVAAGQTTVTYTYGSAVDNGAVVAEYSGVATTSPLDVTASNLTSAASATLSTGTTANTAAANELWIGAFGNNTNTAFTGVTGTGASLYNQTAANTSQVGLADSLTNSAGPATMGCTGANDWWAGAIAVFKPASAPAPTVTSASPTSMTQGAGPTTVTITGANFVSGATVAFSGTGITTGAVTFVSSTQLTVPVTVAANAATGARNVTVTNPDTQTGTGTGVFTVNAAPAPTVTSTSPNAMTQGTGPTTVTVTGTNFLAGATVSFNDANITTGTVTVVNATTITVPVTVASATTTGVKNVTVTLPGGQTGTGTGVFTVNAAAPPPTVTSTSPNSMTQGTGPTTVTITGTNFTGATAVSFNDANITTGALTVVNATTITVPVTVSSATTTGAKNVSVTTPGGTGTGTGVFTVNAAPCTRSAPSVTFTPTSGSVTAGSSLAYTLLITNNDTASCTSSTFLLSLASETGTAANFVLPSTLGATTTGAVSPGGSYSTTLTAKAQSGATAGATNVTAVNAADTTNHATQTGTGSVTTTIAAVWTNYPMLHNSTNLSSTKWAGGWGIPNGKYGAFDCNTCHQVNAPNIKRAKGSFSPTFGIWSSNGAASVSVAFQSVTSMGHDNRTPSTSSTNVCEVCHSRNKYHNYNTAKNTGGTTHNNGVDCTGCHPHKVGFKASESGGNSDCSSCHNDIYGQLNGSTTTYHHYMQNAAVSALASGSKYPNAATLTTTDTNRRCLMCHVDHDIFRPDLNGANGGARGKNLRQDATLLPTTTTGFTRKDFDNSLAGGGLCVSCHTNQQTKNTANQRSDGTTVTPVITKAGFGVSLHNYSTNSTALSDGTRMNANCVKCHSSQNAEASPKTSLGTHDGTARGLFAALGGTLTDPYEEGLCYRCHCKTTDAVGGTVKPAAGKDWYNTRAMSAAAEDTFTSFNGKASGHKPANYGGIHKPTATDENFAYISANKHVECADCHAPHAAQGTDHTAGTNAIAATSPLAGATGVATPTWPAIWTAPAQSAYGTAPAAATQEWQVCFKCHSGANSSVTTWGGTGAATWTDLGLEFNVNNKSAHPVVVNLNGLTGSTGTKALNSAQMKAPWTAVGTQTMFCTDCHMTDSTGGSKGPHGSGVKWMLAGTNKAWPYTSAAQNGGSTGTFFTMGTNTTNAGTVNGLFCENCHDTSTTGHGTGWSTQDTGHTTTACVGCHIRVPHGGKISRLWSTGTTGLPARYAPDGNGTQTAIPMRGFTKANYNSYTQTNCTNTCGGVHAASGGESW